MEKQNIGSIISKDISKLYSCKKAGYILSLLFLTLFIWSCSAKVLPPPEWTYEKEAISLHIKADPKLNLNKGASHTLHLCVYQLNDPNGFNQLSGDLNGLFTLLDCSIFDSSAAVVKQITVHPGETMDIKLDRAENAKYLAVAAGYMKISKQRITRLINIPIVVKKEGFIRTKKTQVPALIDVDLYLGPMQIKDIQTRIDQDR
ncbi:MAG: type VI secretion system lipoprotein TssJ [Desulfobacula sp.]|nr:type VI secretion system lipoprotein TssJ [Desulfobacula sp.]